MHGGLNLELLSEAFAICRLSADSPLPDIPGGRFVSITRTDDELSLICVEDYVPAAARAEKGWRCLKVAGPLDFSLTGILASLANPLAGAGISIFALSTFDTDYLMVRSTDLEEALRTLAEAGHKVSE